MEQAREGAGGAGLERLQHRHDRDEDAGEEDCHLADRHPGEGVLDADARRRDEVGQHGDRQKRAVARRVLVADRDAEAERQRAPRAPEPAHQHGPHHQGKEDGVVPPLDPDAAAQVARRHHGLAPPMPAVEPEEDGQQEERGQRHGTRHGAERPAEADPAQESEEQRRIAQRRQRTADVAHEEDEEDEDMRLVAPVSVGPDQRADQQHGGAGGAQQARRDRADAEEREIGAGRADEVARDPDPARHHEERQQQQDERQILVRQRVEQSLARRPGPAGGGIGQGEE